MICPMQVGLIPTPEAPQPTQCVSHPIPGLYSSEALKEMRTHVVASRAAVQPPPQLQVFNILM